MKVEPDFLQAVMLFIFNESDFQLADICHSKSVYKNLVVDVNLDSAGTTSDTYNAVSPTSSCYPVRERHPPDRYGIDEFITTTASENAHIHTACIASDIPEPTSLVIACTPPTGVQLQIRNFSH